MKARQQRAELVFGLFLPLLMILVITIADFSEGNEHAYVGILASVPPLAAVFGSARIVAFVSVVALSVGIYEISLTEQQSDPVQEQKIVIIGLVSILSIMAARKRMHIEAKLAQSYLNSAINEVEHRHATTDYLTGHLNRYGFTQAMNSLEGDSAVLAIFDLDKFKIVNDLYGHDVGDTFLKIVSTRIFNDLSRDDIFGRWGGDEFLALIRASEVDALTAVKRTIKSTCDSPVVTNAYSLDVNISAGITNWDSSISFEENFDRADKALYEAKDRGGCQVVNFKELPNHGQDSLHAH